MKPVSWIRRKANAYAEGWRRKFDELPTAHNVTLGLAVAWHESFCGDSNVGPHNWGSTQKRKLIDGEIAALTAAGLRPQFPREDFIATARAALDAAVAHGNIMPLEREALYCDSSPSPQGTKWYWIMFWAFDSDEDGAAFFVHVLAEQRPACRAVLKRETGTAIELATAMYGSQGRRYFEGRYDPESLYMRADDGKWYVTADPRGTPGSTINIHEYAAAITKFGPAITDALNGWEIGTPVPPPDPDDLDTPDGRQRALNRVGSAPTLVVDGVWGPKSRESTRYFHRACGLGEDASDMWTEQTTALMREALSRILVSMPTEPSAVS